MRRMLTLIRIWFMGLRECRGDVGITWAQPFDGFNKWDEWDTARNKAYDSGRDFGRRLLRID